MNIEGRISAKRPAATRLTSVRRHRITPYTVPKIRVAKNAIPMRLVNGSIENANTLIERTITTVEVA